MPKAPAPLEPEIIEMEIPATWSSRGHRPRAPLTQHIMDMTPSMKRCLFIPYDPNIPRNVYALKIRRTCQYVRSQHDKAKKFVVRDPIKSGVIEGVGIWRTA